MATPITRLSHADLTAVASSLKELYACTAHDILPRKMISIIFSLVACDSTGYNEWKLSAAGKVRAAVVLTQPAITGINALAAALEQHLPQHPLFQSLLEVTTKPVKISDFVSLNQFKRSAIYNEVYRNVSIEHQMDWFLPHQDGSRICFVLNRHGRDFSERERQLLTHLSPHLRQAHTNAMALAAVRECENAFYSEDRETIHLDGKGCARFFSTRAAAWLKTYFSDVTPLDPWPETLRRWIARQIRPNHFEENHLAPYGPLIVEKESARLRATLYQNSVESPFLLLIESRRKSFADVSRSLPLTDREREVFKWLCEAKTNPEIAVILGLSVRTVHKHIERILGKLGVENRLQAQRIGYELRAS